jgi:hypothetical protein
MSLAHESLLAALTKLSKEQIQQAGSRYTPGVDPNAPNLRIESLFTAIENVACGASALKRFNATLDAFAEAWDRAKRGSQRADAIQVRVDDARAFVPQLMRRLRARDATVADEWSAHLSGMETELTADVTRWRAEEAKLPPSERDSSYTAERENVLSNINILGRCLYIVREEQEYVDSAPFKALFDPQLLLTGEWGTGKTHLLCDLTQARVARNQATAFVLAKNFRDNPVAEVCARIDSGCTVIDVFDRLEALAAETSERALVILDGVNEGSRFEWRDAVTKFQTLVADRPNIGLIVTCRTSLEPVAIEQTTLNSLHKVMHRGFEDQEFDAQAAFFQYYNLPLPEVPLLDSEFSRPLTLKLICQSLQDLTGKKLAKGFAGIASGQKGMTYVLETFVNRVGGSIERQYGLRQKGCWELLKGNDRVADRRLAGFASCMSATLRGYVLRSEADRIIAANYPALRTAQRHELLNELRISGLIDEDAVWYSAKSGFKSRVVYRLPYQRFSDHLVARHLLKALDLSSATSIKQGFAAKSPLSRIFRMSSRHGKQYAEPGWAQALITEFPERVGNRLAPRQRELFFVLPSRSQNLSAYFEPFIDGIFWRDPAAFTEGTQLIVNQYLNATTQTWERTVDALAAVSTKPKHPYHAKRLYAFLARYAMPDRDLRWSEYLRRKHASPTIHRLLTWAQKLNVAHMTQGSAIELVVLLSLILTTVVRSDRDLATKALVMIGEQFPELLFAQVVESLAFNDPYVPERMLAAAYGTTLSLVDSDRATNFQPTLGALAKNLYKQMFAPRARYATHHTLMRDYALGIIQLAQRANCVSLPETASLHMAPPFLNVRSTFASDGTPDESVTAAIGHAIHMDFGNYTIGRLIPNRANYDDGKPEYVQVRAKIERRMFDLGYRAERFEHVDAEIGRASWRARGQEKVDRYGKKYSWIAYFEMWGEREVARKLPGWRLGERTSDCGVDPSFPKRPPDWCPPIPDLFGDAKSSTEDWVKGGFTPNWSSLLVVPKINDYSGEWVLLEGFVQRSDEAHDRELFAFLRGIFIARKDVRKFRTKFLAIDYPGNLAIPEAATEYYLYAGEAGRRKNFARRLYQVNGRYRRQLADAFDRHVRVPTEASAATTATAEVGVTTNHELGMPKALSELLDPVPKFRRIRGIRIELPIISFGWESYHSPQNDFSGFKLPAPSLIQRLSLASRNREIDFYDSTCVPGTLYREAGHGWRGNRHSLLYIRADLLRRYLTDTRQVLVWCNWGERDWLMKMEGHSVIHSHARQRIWQTHSHVHRSFHQWSAKDSKVV